MNAPAQPEPGSTFEVDSPIINSPFCAPRFHWQIKKGELPVKAKGRRPASYYYRIPERAGRGARRSAEQELFGKADVGQEEELALVNTLRRKVAAWRAGELTGRPYDGASTITRELLALWRSEDRMQRLFFAQVEAAETVIFLVEAAAPYRQDIPKVPLDEPSDTAKAAGFSAFLRYACKMATGTGKTTVMGMLAAWSVLNHVAAPTDDRFSDTVLIVCPNVTIRERLQELDPARGDLSLYRTRQLVPPHRMEDLRHGEVMIANWQRLAKQETNTVNGQSARVVKTGEAVVVIKNAGRTDETRETKYYESDAAWFKRIRQELGSGRGRAPQWLIFNDEAHHAYRRGDRATDDTEDDEDEDTVKSNERTATVWIEALDRINKLAGGRRKGIRFCADFSATPFYIQGSGNEVGRPFPWVVSDFGLLDAIESGLVKIPQLPSRDATGADEAAYFNIWRWVQQQAAQDGYGTRLTPQIVMSYASAPINLLAQDWHQRFVEWQTTAKQRHRHPVPPAFIVVCRDTKVAKAVYEWLADGEGGHGEAPQWFRNKPGEEVTVRIDSKVMDDIAEGGTKDETRRLRFILDTVGKPEWPGGKVPDEWAELVRKHNAKAANDEDGTLKWIDERIPPGRDVRCIVSVSMLSEGWDANTVTHIVGLRPFGSQLLCEQVVGRALRRRSYALLDDGSEQFAEETAKVFGVPFELVPFKVRATHDSKEKSDPNHIYSVPDKAKYEITFPMVTGYQQDGQSNIALDWSRIATVTLDEMQIPQTVELTAMTAPEGALSAYGPGTHAKLTLREWRKQFRDQQVAFRLAREVCRRWQEENGQDSVPATQLFQAALFAARRFIADPAKLIRKGDSRACDILAVGKYMQEVVSTLMGAIRRGDSDNVPELPVIPQGSSGRGSSVYVDFYSTKPIYPVTKCHLNAMVADTKKWEQSTAFALDAQSDHVVRWVKNDHVGFYIPYRKRNIPARYIPDFIAVLDNGLQLIIETKGRYGDDADLKAKAAQRWVDAVNRLGEHGHWEYKVVDGPQKVLPLIDKLAEQPSIDATGMALARHHDVSEPRTPNSH